MKMSRAKKDILYLLFFAVLATLTLGLLEARTRVPLMDFRTAYYSAKCLVEHCDPYSQSDVLRLYAQHFDISNVSARDRLVLTRNVYLPSEFGFTLFFALLPFGLAQVLWFLLTAGSFFLAVSLVFQMAAGHARGITFILICFYLANCESIFHYGNPAGVAVPLCVIAVWCFLRERFVYWGILCLAVSLALKPHDAGLVWLFFLLSGPTCRKRALQTLAVVAAISLPAALWVMQLSPHWWQELSATQQQFFAHGGINDPNGDHGTCAITSLQAIFSYFWDNPHIYNIASYLVCAPLLIVWAVVTLKARSSQAKTYFALASIAALSLLPVYHRQYDAKIIILTLPAFALLWDRGGSMRWLALLVTVQGFLLNADLVWAIFVGQLVSLNLLHLNAAGNFGPVMTAVMNFPVSISLLIMGLFYLWVYTRSVVPSVEEESPAALDPHSPRATSSTAGQFPNPGVAAYPVSSHDSP